MQWNDKAGAGKRATSGMTTGAQRAGSAVKRFDKRLDGYFCVPVRKRSNCDAAE
jgi:hypothetical protein